MSDRELREIEQLNNPKTVVSQRGSRKGFITRAENHYLANLLPLPLRSLKVSDIERCLEDLKKHVDLYDALQLRYCTLTAPEGEPSAEDLEAHDLVSVCHEDLVDKYQGLVDTVKVYKHGTAMLTQLEYFESTDDKIPCRNAILDMQRAASEFRAIALPHEHTELETLVTDLVRRAHHLVRISTPPTVTSTATTTTTAIATSGPGPSLIRPNIPQLQIPSFTGKSLQWTSFWTLFSAILSGNPGLDQVQKTTYLLAAMSTDEDRAFVAEAAGDTFDYDHAVVSLRERYELKHPIFTTHFRNWSSDKTINLKRKDISEVISQTKASLKSFQFCGAHTVDHLTAARLEARLSDKLRQRWLDSTRELKCLPTLEQLYQFLEGELVILPEEDIKPKPSQQSFQPTQFTRKAKVNVLRTDSSKPSVCPARKGSFHPLFTCDEFRSWDLSRHHKFVKTNRLCLNCLSRSHMVRDCGSTKTCRQCGAKHHTLLHRTSNGNSGSSPTSMPPTDPTTPRSANVSCVQLPQRSSLL